MQEELGSKPTSPAASASNAVLSSSRQKEQMRGATNRLRMLDIADRVDFMVFLDYCAYVSANANALGLDGFDTRYSVSEARHNLGNEYLATDFVEYYASLCLQNPALPDLRGISFRAEDLSKAISNTTPLDAMSMRLKVETDGTTAISIWASLSGLYATDWLGRRESGSCSSYFLADLVVRLADVDGKSVLDFVCGNGLFLSTALANGAASVCGRDINARAVMRAKILCFFANTTASRDIAVADVLSNVPVTVPVQRVLAAPPFGVRLREFDIQEKDYYTDVLSQLVGDGAMGTLELEDFCVAKALASLTDDGVAILHVSASYLFRQQKARKSLRNALVEGGYLRTVIELPGGCVPGTTVKSALLVLGRQPTEDGVLIVDLDSKGLVDKGYVTKGRGRCEITNAGIDWLAKMVEQRDEIPLVSTVAERDTILKSGSDLCYSTYGDVFDYGTILDETRSTQDIMGDIRAAEASVDSLGEQIADILKSIEKEG